MSSQSDHSDDQSPTAGCSSTDYIPTVTPSVLASVKEELARKEEQQKQHYFYLSELQSMTHDLPRLGCL